MEEKKFDPYQLIGFILIAGIFTWMLSVQEPVTEANVENTATQDNIQSEETSSIAQVSTNAMVSPNLGDFTELASAAQTQQQIVLENNQIYLKVNTQGGFISEAQLKGLNDFKGDPVYLIKDGNEHFDLTFFNRANQRIQTKQLFFTPSLSTQDNAQVLSMKMVISERQFIEYRYTLPNDGYMLDFSVTSEGFSALTNGDKEVALDWNLKGFRQAKSVIYENRYTELKYQYEGDKIGYLSAASDDDDKDIDVSWVSYNQHFFSMILIPNTPFDEVSFVSENLVEDEGKEVIFTKNFQSQIPLKITQGELNSHFQWYVGPADYDVLKKLDNDLTDSISFGWGIFGWINRFVFFPLFGFLSGFLPHGIAIILMTIIVRFAMSPVTYKSYLSQAKMKVLKPEITVLNDKFKKDAVKRQQETMKLYRKAGVNPMSGCVPALLQLPVFYALFCFFPVAFALRQKSFLWADDLSSYDVIAELPFNIPFYGDHISLFPILASIAIFFYTMMTTGQQMQNPQPGMPNMKFIMYLMPLMMLVFFNNYASGLSLYYFISNLITIIIMLVIKNYIINDDKIHAQIEENKKKPKKQNRFQRKLQEVMEQAEEQQKLNKRK